MRYVLFPLAALCLAACLPDDLDTMEMSPRPAAQTAQEVAFVTALFDDIQPRSIAENREYCGLIGLDGAGDLVASVPVPGREASCLPPAPSAMSFTVLASYHTHGASSPDYFGEVPSFDDMRTDIEDNTDGYVATPGGRIWYVDARNRVARLVCGLSCVRADPDHTDDPDLPLSETYTLDDLREF